MKLRITLTAAIALAIAACATVGGTPTEKIGLARGGLYEAPPPAVLVEDSSPGDRPVVAKETPTDPNIIPHAVAEHLPITTEENACVDCHGVKTKVKGEATPIPTSHYIDFRNAPGKAGSTLAGARHNCVACHATRSNARPLVKNGFAN